MCRLRVLLAFLLLPVVFLSSSVTPASAGYVGIGEPVDAVAFREPIGPQNDSGCRFRARTRLDEAGVKTIKLVARCRAQQLAPREATRWFVLRGDAAGCSFSSTPAAPVNGNVATTYILSASGAVPAGCTITKGEWHYTEAWGVGGGDDCTNRGQTCPVTTFDYPLGGFPAGGQSNLYNGADACPVMKVNRVPVLRTWQREAYPAGYGTSSGKLHYRVKIDTDMTWKAAPPTPTTHRMFLRFVYRNESNVLSFSGFTNSSDQNTAPNSTSNVVTAQHAALVTSSWEMIKGGSSDDPSGWTFVGVQVGVISYPATSTGFQDGLMGSQTVQRGLGTTNAANCWWWFGPKIVDITGSEVDEPAGALSLTQTGGTVTEPTDTDPDNVLDAEESECPGFSLTDPGSWAGAGVCQMVKGLNSMLGWMNGFGDLMYSLFVPNPASWNVQSVLDQWESRPPGSLISGGANAITGIATSYNNADQGTCSGIDFGEATIPCGGGGPAYDVVYTFVQWGLVMTTGVYVFSIIRKSVTKGGD